MNDKIQVDNSGQFQPTPRPTAPQPGPDEENPFKLFASPIARSVLLGFLRGAVLGAIFISVIETVSQHYTPWVPLWLRMLAPTLYWGAFGGFVGLAIALVKKHVVQNRAKPDRLTPSCFPTWLWVGCILWHFAVALPFWCYYQPAPYFDAHGDLYRGWPLVYGLDQGDVGGDEYLFFTTYFRPGACVIDTLLAFLCALPVSFFAIWFWLRRCGRKTP